MTAFTPDEITSAIRLLRGRQAVLAKRRQRAIARHDSLQQQAAKFMLDESVRVVRDHDGPDGRWVGVIAKTAGFHWDNPDFPWRIRAPSGAEMYCTADMIERVDETNQ